MSKGIHPFVSKNRRGSCERGLVGEQGRVTLVGEQGRVTLVGDQLIAESLVLSHSFQVVR